MCTLIKQCLDVDFFLGHYYVCKSAQVLLLCAAFGVWATVMIVKHILEDK